MSSFRTTGPALYDSRAYPEGASITTTDSAHNWTSLDSTVAYTYNTTGSTTLSPGQHNIRLRTESGLEGSFKLTKKDEDSGLHPRLYFKYVKSKMTKLQQEKLKHQLGKLRKVIPMVKSLGQQALYEALAKELALVVKQSEIIACGIEQTVSRSVIERFRYKVSEQVEIGLVELKDYDRIVPDKVAKRIKQCWKYGLFHNYWVLYTDHKVKEDVDGSKKEEKKLKTNHQKIKEKDPILFGTLEHDPKTFYFIIDWEDEYCDLTLNKFLETVREDEPEFAMDSVPEMDEEMMREIIEEVERKEGRLANTDRHNYKGLMEEEEAENSRSLKDARKKIALARLRAKGNVKEATKAVKKTWYGIWKHVSSISEKVVDAKDSIVDKLRR